MSRFRVISSAWRRVIFRCSAMSSAVTNGSGVMLFVFRLPAFRARSHLARIRHKSHLVARFLNSHWEPPTIFSGSTPEIGGDWPPRRTQKCRMIVLRRFQWRFFSCPNTCTLGAHKPRATFRRSGSRRLRSALLLRPNRGFVKRATGRVMPGTGELGGELAYFDVIPTVSTMPSISTSVDGR
jgi:hypothetical protein